METIGKTIKKTMETKSLPSPISPRSSLPEPEKFCPDCGSRIEFVFVGNPIFLKAMGKEPHWAELPCKVCEEKRRKREEEERRNKLRQERINTLLKNSMLKKRFVQKTFDSFIPYGKEKAKQSRVLSIVREFAANFRHHREAGTWLLFMGNVGTGKGHLSAAIINEIVKSGFSALYTKMPRLLREIKDTFNHNSEITQGEIICQIEKVDLLVIDEVGIQFGTDTERMIIYEILDSRYEDMMPTILTTNVKEIKTLEKLLGERIIDRFYEGESKILLFDWESYRRYQRGIKRTEEG